jgi:deazaflavin-dependent oxidoreductase (nitroreductase family)
MGLWADLQLPPARTGQAQRALQAVAASAAGARVASRVAAPLDTVVRRVARGRTATEVLAGLPTVVLTTRGARTGRERHSHLLAVPCGEDVAVIGSNFGGERTPGWVHNLRAGATAAVGYRERSVAVTARALDGEEAEQVWTTAGALYAGYPAYRRRAAHRTITVWLLQPAPRR